MPHLIHPSTIELLVVPKRSHFLNLRYLAHDLKCPSYFVSLMNDYLYFKLQLKYHLFLDASLTPQDRVKFFWVFWAPCSFLYCII